MVSARVIEKSAKTTNATLRATVFRTKKKKKRKKNSKIKTRSMTPVRE